MQSIVPFIGGQRIASHRPADPLQAFRTEMDRVFNDFFTGFGASGLALIQSGGLPVPVVTPQIDVSETNRDIQIKADVPGLEENEVEVFVIDDVLTLRGEKKAEREEKQRGYRLVERASGAFSRVLRLPFNIDPAQVQAEFKNGVLTITIPKPREAPEKIHKIEVKKAVAPAETADANPADARPADARSADSGQVAASPAGSGQAATA
jgi:HSP20 family protein